MCNELLDDTDEEMAFQKWEKENSVDGLIMEHLPDPPPPVDLEYFLYGSYSDDEEAMRISNCLAEFFVDIREKKFHFFIPYLNAGNPSIIHWADNLETFQARIVEEGLAWGSVEIRVMDPETLAAGDVSFINSIESSIQLMINLFGIEYVNGMVEKFLIRDGETMSKQILMKT